MFVKGFLVCYDKNKKEIAKISLLKLPIKEEEIVRQSIKLYKEEEPCIIYRTSIINRTGLNILSDIEKTQKNNIMLDLNGLNMIIGDILDLPNKTRYVKFI